METMEIFTMSSDDEHEIVPGLKCIHCNFTTPNDEVLQEHVNQHRELLREFKCTQCKYSTWSLPHFKEHQDTHKDIISGSAPSCILCGHKAKRRREIMDHLTSFHCLVLKRRNLRFNDFDQFLRWKEEFERQSASKFVRTTGSRATKSSFFHLFRCHRDGFFNTRGHGLRRLRKCGSNKMNGCCPAEIRVSVDKVTSKVRGHVVETHVGHLNATEELVHTKREKESFPAKAVAKKSPNIIDCEINEEAVPDEPKQADLDNNLLNLKSDAIWLKNDYPIVFFFEDSNKSSESFENKKQKLQLEIHHTLSHVETLEDIKIFSDALAPLIPMMDAAKKENITSQPKVNSRNRALPQKSNFSSKSTKKKKTSRNKRT